MIPAASNGGWSTKALKRLQEALKAVDDEEFLGGILASLEEVTNLDVASRDAAYDAAFDRALRQTRRSGKNFVRHFERRERALDALRTTEGARAYDRYTALLRHRGLPLAEAYLKFSFELRYKDSRAMREAAEIACSIAETTPHESYPPGLILDLRARASAELANAYRVNNDLASADAALDRAKTWLDQGTGDLGLLALVHEIEASLRSNQRRASEALNLLNRAHSLYLDIGEFHLAGRTLVSRSRVLHTDGKPNEAVVSLERGLALLEPDRDPQLVVACRQALIGYLVDCGEYSRAGKLLLESGLGEAFAGEPLNQLRLRWVEGRIHAGTGRLKRAESILEEVYTAFKDLELHYDAALVGLDLAAVWLRQGEAGRLHPLAIEMADTFWSLRIHEEAYAALTVLDIACERRVADAGVVERTRDFLARCRHDPKLKVDVPRLILGR